MSRTLWSILSMIFSNPALILSHSGPHSSHRVRLKWISLAGALIGRTITFRHRRFRNMNKNLKFFSSLSLLDLGIWMPWKIVRDRQNVNSNNVFCARFNSANQLFYYFIAAAFATQWRWVRFSWGLNFRSNKFRYRVCVCAACAHP